MSLDNLIERVLGEVVNYIRLQRYRRKNKWNGLIQGDIVELGDERYMYIRLNQNGVIGIPIIPLPYFVRADPHKTPGTMYYLNETYKQFGESKISGSYQIMPLNAQRSDLKKVGHYSPREWNRMTKEAKPSGKAN